MMVYVIAFEILILIIFVCMLYYFLFKNHNICMLLFYCFIQLGMIFFILIQNEQSKWFHIIDVILVYLSVYEICVMFKKEREGEILDN